MDGETSVSSGFVATFARERYGLLFHTPRRRLLDIELRHEGAVRIATGDVLGVETPQGNLIATFSHWHTLIGVVPDDTRLQLGIEAGPVAAWQSHFRLSEDAENRDALALIEHEGRFALSYGESVAQARQRAEAGMGLEVGDEVSKRLAAYRNVPALKSPERDRLLKKCFSVMRVNTLSREGTIQQTWSTPDRVPHRHMWLWDSVFHSFGMNRLFPKLSWDFLKSVLDTQRADGMIPIQMTANRGPSWPSAIQPPILAWGVWENYLARQDKSCLEYALPRLETLSGMGLREPGPGWEWPAGMVSRSRQEAPRWRSGHGQLATLRPGRSLRCRGFLGPRGPRHAVHGADCRGVGGGRAGASLGAAVEGNVRAGASQPVARRGRLLLRPGAGWAVYPSQSHQWLLPALA